MRRVREEASQHFQVVAFLLAKRVGGGRTILEPPHMQGLLSEVHLFPAQIGRFRNTQAMSIRNQDQSRVAQPVQSYASGRRDQVARFFLGQKLPAADRRVGHAPRRAMGMSVGHREDSWPRVAGQSRLNTWQFRAIRISKTPFSPSATRLGHLAILKSGHGRNRANWRVSARNRA